MGLSPGAAVDVAASVLSISEAAWKLATSLSRLSQHARYVDTTIQDLAGDVKSLSNQCNLVYAEIEAGASKSRIESPTARDASERIWGCLEAQVEEIGRTMQELNSFIGNKEEEKSANNAKAHHPWKANNRQEHVVRIGTKVRRHNDNLHTTRLLIDM